MRLSSDIAMDTERGSPDPQRNRPMEDAKKREEGGEKTDRSGPETESNFTIETEDAARALEEISKRKKELVDALAILQQKERQVMQQISEEEISFTEVDARAVAQIGEGMLHAETVSIGESFEDAVKSITRESKFGELNIPLAKHMARQLLELLRRMYAYVNEKSRQKNEQYSAHVYLPEATEKRDELLEPLFSAMMSIYEKHEEEIVFSYQEILDYLRKHMGDFIWDDMDRQIIEQHAEEMLTKIVRGMTRLIIVDLPTIKAHDYVEVDSEEVIVKKNDPKQWAKEKTGMELHILLAYVTKHILEKNFKKSEETVTINLRKLRHDCLDELNNFTLKYDVRSALSVEMDQLHDNNHRISLGTDYLAFSQELSQEQALIEHARGETMRPHFRLKSSMLRFVNTDTRVRLAGFTSEGGIMPSLIPDLIKFRALEDVLTEWKLPLLQRKDKPDLLPEERHAIKRFHTEGGHSGILSARETEYIMRHGIILFFEKKIRDDLWVVLGSISSLTRYPDAPPADQKPSRRQAQELIKNENPQEWQTTAGQLFPQYNIRTMVFPQNRIKREHRQRQEQLHEWLVLCRTSIYATLHQALQAQYPGEAFPDVPDLSLRQLGVASVLKLVSFRVAQMLQKKYLTFNIGTITEEGQAGLKMKNGPSSLHNHWTTDVTFRSYYTPIKDNLYIYWNDKEAEIQRAIEEMTWEYGMVKGKGYNMQMPEQSAEEILLQLLQMISRGDHAPL